MSWETSNRKEELPDDWETLRRRILERDHYRCTWRLPSGKRCPRRANQVDHRKPGDDHSPQNLQSLCEHHHGRKSAREGYTAKRAMKRSRVRPAETHPGTVR